MSEIDGIVKIATDTTVTPFGTTEVKGVIRAPNHYKHINVVIDNCKGVMKIKDDEVSNCCIIFNFILYSNGSVVNTVFTCAGTLVLICSAVMCSLLRHVVK